MSKTFLRILCRTCQRLGVLAAAVIILRPLSGCYIVSTATAHLRNIVKAISVEKALGLPLVSDEDKAKIRLIQEIRYFTESVMGLNETSNYTTYIQGEKKPAMFVLTAAPKDSLQPYTWTYPVIGKTLYKSFFNEDEAKKEQQELEAKGYDTWLRPTDGYSTGGYFIDPILPIMFDRNTASLARLIVHELSHATLYRHEAAEFSESFAMFVDREGSRQFLSARFGADSPEVRMLNNELADVDLYNTFVRGAAGKLRAFYASKPADVISAREKVFEEIRADYERILPRFRTEAYRNSSFKQLNNAMLNAYLTYSNFTPFETAFNAVGRDWSRFVSICKIAVKDKDPFRKLQKLSRAGRK